MSLFDTVHTSSIYHSVVTMALSCIVSHITPDSGQKLQNLYTPLVFNAPAWRNFAQMFSTRNTRMM